jgi:hypothetical protein
MNLHLCAEEIETFQQMIICDTRQIEDKIYVYIGEAFVSDWFVLAFTV